MRRIASLLGGAAVIAAGFMIPGASPASAACELDGTIPGSGPKVTRIDVSRDVIFYIDDRDLEDLDGDDQAGGLWIYQETLRHAGLQRGGTNWVVELINPHVGRVPYVPPQKVSYPGGPAPLPIPAVNQTLFPNGIGGGDLATTLGARDECVTLGPDGKPLPPDKVWF